jgi:hypothetical protein
MNEVDFIGQNLIAVTFDRKLDSIIVEDLSFFKNSENLAAITINNEGHTVIFYESATPINSESFSVKDKIVAAVYKVAVKSNVSKDFVILLLSEEINKRLITEGTERY